MAFEGYLLKFGDTILPNKYLYYDSYSATPNQRAELDAYRDDFTQELFRATSEGVKTKIEATIKPMWLEDKLEYMDIIKNGLVDKLQRKYEITYWNDEDASYSTGYFYIPDTQFSVYLVDADKKSILYNAFKLTLVEY